MLIAICMSLPVLYTLHRWVLMVSVRLWSLYFCKLNKVREWFEFQCCACSFLPQNLFATGFAVMVAFSS